MNVFMMIESISPLISLKSWQPVAVSFSIPSPAMVSRSFPYREVPGKPHLKVLWLPFP